MIHVRNVGIIYNPKLIITIFIAVINLASPTGITAQTGNYQMFDNYKLDVDATSVRYFVQDASGLMWICTDKGLFSFDGYTASPHFTSGDKTNNNTNCAILINDNELLVGSESGFLFYNIRTHQYKPFLNDFQQDVRALLKVGNEIWIGCYNGIFIYDLELKELKKLHTANRNGSSPNMIYTLLEHDGYVYLGSNNRFGRFSLKTKKYEVVDTAGIGGDFLLNYLYKDDERKCIWIGQGSSLLQYFTDTGLLKQVNEFDVVKSISLDDNNNVVIGTDNGLCVYNEDKTQYITHDSRESNSLANNVVWNVFTDRSGNIWLGTNNGISLSPKSRRLRQIPLFAITRTGEGNQFYSLHKDSYNNYWLGGTNGLIRSKKNDEFDNSSRWYKMGGSPNIISHNRIRDIFEDKDRNLWIATDYGINRYNSKTQQFMWYSIYTANRKQYANWTYDILEDDLNRLWVASYNDGIFVIDKKKLLSDNSIQIADIHYSTDDGLSGNNVDFIASDKNGNIWALIHKVALDYINISTGEIHKFPIKDHTGGIIPKYMMSDSKGDIWAGYTKGAIHIDTQNNNVNNIHFDNSKNVNVLAMAEVQNSIWVSTTKGIWVIDKNDLKARRFGAINHVYSSMYYDINKGEVVLGGMDEISLLNTDMKVDIKPQKIMISELYVNNHKYQNQNAPSVPYMDEVKLSYNQNNLIIKISDLMYSKENRGIFIYKVNDEENWTPLPLGENNIQLNKLDPGKYQLAIGRMSYEDTEAKSIKYFNIVIAPPWYGSLMARIFYALFLLSLVWWVYFFIRARNRMKYERMEKEKTLEQAKLKVSFFSDVAHEFKTPLSLIIAPLSGLINGMKDKKDRIALEMIHKNAMKLNSLIHQAIDYYRDDSKVNIGLLLSKVELIEFARSIFLTYKEGRKDKEIEFIFNTNVDHFYFNIDLVKIESVFNNLLSNACKFTNPGDSIIFSIEYNEQDNNIEIKVSDTGTGIPKQDLPYIFQRFFQSNSNTQKHKGKGIGLFLVKNYIELHGGEVNAISEPDEGTTFFLQLPVMESKLEEKPVDQKAKDNIKEKQLILVVEDNAAIAEFVYNTFIDEYRCVIANNGKAGLKACMDIKPDLIIADIMMPVMDGIEMAKRIKANTLTATIPLVFLTAKDDKETELESIQLNIDAFIAKPFDSSILYSRVNQILENRRLLEQKARIEHISSPTFEKTESQDEKFLAKITKIIEDKIAEPELNVNMLCDIAEISSKQLYRKVKQLTGMTTVDYIKSIRMKKAAMYLANNNFTIAEVMYMVGFSNHSYFAKCFQAKFGKAPRQYIEIQDIKNQPSDIN